MSTRRLHNVNAVEALMGNSVAHLLFSAYAKRHEMKVEDVVVDRVTERDMDYKTAFKIEFTHNNVPGFVEFGYTLH